MSERDLAPGTVLLDKYRVEEHLGVGGMGRVVRASHLYLQQSVAIKVLLPQATDSDATVARFLREAQAAVRLKSEHTARVLDVGTLSDGRPYMVMEYLEGNDLNQVLRHHGPQDPDIVCDLMLQACEGLAEAHAIGIVHRDIKPSNFFITRRADGSMLLKILDFGISKAPINYDDNLTQTHTVIGTPSYMAPEQMKSGRAADARSDIWSMGIVMYQLLHGRPPFAADSFPELAIKVAQEPPTPIHVPLPPGYGAAILRCLEKHPNQRHQSVAELARMLAPYSSDPITATQIANRTARILATRAAQPTIERGALPGQQSLPIGANGGLAAPLPLSPSQLTPRSWPPTSTAGGGQVGRHQLTHKTGSSRGWLIAGAMSLTILAASGGFIASTVMKDDAPATSTTPASTTSTTPASTTPVSTTPAAATITPPTVPPVPTVAPRATDAVPTTTETATVTVPSAPATATSPTATTSPSATETTATSPTPKASTSPKTSKSSTKATTSSTKTRTSTPTAAAKPLSTTKATSTSSATSTTKPAPTKPAATKAKAKAKASSSGLFDSRH